ncbi:hypothetical protein AB1Y20_013487 [Prymnesium parvum]|uniref:ADP ribosyltransferase domain-containing protein n=1 Tax=Prymnesium parvum TaxID=97485 RepID=A0AB34IHL6_PRYPA
MPQSPKGKPKVREATEKPTKKDALAKIKEKQEAVIRTKKKGAERKNVIKEEISPRKKKGKEEKASADGEGDDDDTKKTEADVKKEEAENKKKEEARAKKKKKEEVRELPPDQNPVDAEWTAKTWLGALDLESVIETALKPPEPDGSGAAFNYIRGLSRNDVEAMLNQANLGGLTHVIFEGIQKLQKQAASTAFVLNNTKFKSEGRFEMAYGALALFYGGLESLIGPPQMIDGSLIRSMEQEHCTRPDSTLKFTSSNGMTSISRDEWEVAYEPFPEKEYAERVNFKDEHPEWCRQVKPLSSFEPEMERINAKLSREGHALLIIEELLGGRLYTGPLYHKYNHVLRAKSGNPFINDMYKKMCKDNQYPTTIHAINSLIIKLSKLTVATKVYRGFCYAKLPDSFWTRNSEGIRCGIEYGFSSTTTERSVAEHYGTGPAGTIFEMQMGLVDRGAELVWISQYPHEAEILFPPLTGLEMSNAEVDVNQLVVSTRLSVNLTALTLEQVVSKRRKMIMDMGEGMTMEIKEELKERPEDAETATMLLKKGLEAGPYSFSPKWYNDDENFSKAVSMSLGLKKTVVVDGVKLPVQTDDRLPLLHGSFKNFKPQRNNHQRTLLLAAWLKINSKVATLDLRSMGLEPHEVEFLVHIFKKTQVIVTADMRENGEMGTEAAQMLVDQVLRQDTNTIGSLCGVTKTKISLSIPRKDIPPTDLIFIAEELEANSWAESNSGKGKPHAEIRRRSSRSYGDWSPLLFAAREGIPDLCHVLIKRKADINQKDQDKLNPGYTALITAATRGDMELVELLVNAEADLTAGDRNGKTALMLAEQRGFTSIAEFLHSKMATDAPDQDKADGEKKDEGGADRSKERNTLNQISMYKGLQEKAAQKEKDRLMAAAQLADQRYERWAKLSDELKVCQALEAAAKLECDEAMAAKEAISSSKNRRTGMGSPMSAQQLMASAVSAKAHRMSSNADEPGSIASTLSENWTLLSRTTAIIPEGEKARCNDGATRRASAVAAAVPTPYRATVCTSAGAPGVMRTSSAPAQSNRARSVVGAECATPKSPSRVTIAEDTTGRSPPEDITLP